MTNIIIAAVVMLFVMASARAGSASNQPEEAPDALDSCPRCGNDLPCNCNHDEDTSYHHQHHRGQWADDTTNQWSEDDSCFAHSHHHHGSSDDWN